MLDKVIDVIDIVLVFLLLILRPATLLKKRPWQGVLHSLSIKSIFSDKMD